MALSALNLTGARPRAFAPPTFAPPKFAPPKLAAPRWETENVLNAWLDKGAAPKDGSGPLADDAAWTGPRLPAELVYDTRDQALPTGIRAIVMEGSRRLLYTADELEVLLRVNSASDDAKFDLVGQVLNEGVPASGVPVRLGGGADQATTDRVGSFKLPGVPAGTCSLEIHISGSVLDVSPIDLNQK